MKNSLLCDFFLSATVSVSAVIDLTSSAADAPSKESVHFIQPLKERIVREVGYGLRVSNPRDGLLKQHHLYGESCTVILQDGTRRCRSE
jgi:hypothetical protein